MLTLDQVRIGVIGLGYVGLPLAVEFGRKYPTVGYDLNVARVNELREGHAATLEVAPELLAEARHLEYSADPADLNDCNVYIVTVPTPVGTDKRPLLNPLRSASDLLGRVVSRGDIVIFESTVYPGATEEVCIPLIEAGSGLTLNEDFFAGYSPERINPGDKQHRLPNILKVTSGSTPEAADLLDALVDVAAELGEVEVLDRAGDGVGDLHGGAPLGASISAGVALRSLW